VSSVEAVLTVTEVKAPFRRGDSNEDGTFDLSDPIHLLSYLFKNGPAGVCKDAMDADDSGTLNLADPIVLLLYLFGRGDMPPIPFSACDFDPTPDDALRCPSFPPCGK
jgi:hypothetical protein